MKVVKYSITFILVLLPILANCSESGIRPLAAHSNQAILSLSGNLEDNGWYTSDVEASLYVLGSDAGLFTVEYALYNQGWSTYEEPFTIYEEGQTVIYYRIRNDENDFVGETKFSMVDIDKTPPTGLLIIDKNQAVTYDTNLTLTITANDTPSGPTTLPPSGYIWGVPSGPSAMRFSNNGVVWSTWESINPEKVWAIEPGEGIKIVYGQVRDNAGLISQVFSDNIELVSTNDLESPQTSIIVNGKQNSMKIYTSAVTISFSAIDDLSGINVTQYSFDNSNWSVYTSPITIFSEGKTIIYYRSQDMAGNVEPVLLHTINLQLNKNEDTSNSPIYYIFLGSFVVITIAITIYLKVLKKPRI